MKFCILAPPFTIRYSEKVMVQTIDRISKLGYDGVELVIPEPADVDRRWLKRTISDRGLEVSALATGSARSRGISLSKTPDKALTVMKDYIELACELESRVIVGLIRGDVGSEKPSIEKVSRIARDYGVKLLLEPINRYEIDNINRIDQASELCDEYVRILADTFHMNIEEPSIYGSLIIAKSEIEHIHFSDSNRLAPGLGHSNFKEILRVLQSTGYDGYITFEILPYPSAEESEKLSIEYVKRLYSL